MSCAVFGFIDGLGAPEMGLIFVIVLVLFGGQKLPEFARGLGKSIREFKKAAAGVEDEFKRALEEDERKHIPPALPEPSPTPPNPAAGDPGGPDSSSEYYDHDHSYDHDGSEKPVAEGEPAMTSESAPEAEPAPAIESTPTAATIADESSPAPKTPAAPPDSPAISPPAPASVPLPDPPAPPLGGNPDQKP